MGQKTVINLIQDLATPHNNVLISQFKGDSKVQLKPWYARDQDQQRYQWANNISPEHFVAQIYGASINWRFVKYCLTHKEEKFCIIGWANHNTRLITLLFFILRRPFNHWTDRPSSQVSNSSIIQKLLRWLAYKILKYSKAKVFCAGTACINYFQKLGFQEERLVNLPIFVDVDEDLTLYQEQRDNVFAKYKIDPGDFLLVAGSRIVYSKGYDLLIKAIALLDEDTRQHIKVVIVGSGSSVQDLEELIVDLKLSAQIILEKWLDIEDFKALIANGDIFIHPAREDSYGGTILGMALGLPVVGSTGAGAAVDRIEHGVNGFLYEAEDIQTLSNFITLLYQNPQLRKRMGREAHSTALMWPPRRGFKILVENAI
jgi:glycosyltransferase involved in cell wall biosynthesis